MDNLKAVPILGIIGIFCLNESFASDKNDTLRDRCMRYSSNQISTVIDVYGNDNYQYITEFCNQFDNHEDIFEDFRTDKKGQEMLAKLIANIRIHQNTTPNFGCFIYGIYENNGDRLEGLLSQRPIPKKEGRVQSYDLYGPYTEKIAKEYENDLVNPSINRMSWGLIKTEVKCFL